MTIYFVVRSLKRRRKLIIIAIILALHSCDEEWKKLSSPHYSLSSLNEQPIRMRQVTERECEAKKVIEQQIDGKMV